jgi:predicted nucleic acid-binding protein
VKDSALVLDASVIINVLATGCAEQLLHALPHRCLIVATTSREVLRHPLDRKATGDPLKKLVDEGLLVRTTLPDAALGRFMEFVQARTPDDLDDGEAASLATSEALACAVAMDERKGRRIARARFPDLVLHSSVDLFRDPIVSAALGTKLSEAVYSALIHANMRVLDEHVQWVRELVGAERIANCPSMRRAR